MHRAWETWELEVTENVNRNEKARMIWKRYLGCYNQTRIQKGDKFHWSVHYSLIDFPCQFLSAHWFPLLIESCSSAVRRSLHFSFAHFFCLLSTPAHMCVSLSLISIVCCQKSDILFAQWAMRFRVGVSGSHCINLTRVYSQIPLYTAFIVGFCSFRSDLKACNVYGSQLSYTVHPKTGRRKWCSDLSENSWCHSVKEYKINTTWRSHLSHATLSRSSFIQQSYEILSLLGNVKYIEEISIFSQ